MAAVISANHERGYHITAAAAEGGEGEGVEKLVRPDAGVAGVIDAPRGEDVFACKLPLVFFPSFPRLAGPSRFDAPLWRSGRKTSSARSSPTPTWPRPQWAVGLERGERERIKMMTAIRVEM